LESPSQRLSPQGIVKTAQLSLFAQTCRLPTVTTTVGQLTPGERKLNSEREQMQESSLQSCVDSVGISLLSDWDVLAFVYRHATSLTSADQIARLIGYESRVVGGALDRLEHQKLIERSRPSRGVRLYRVLDSKDVGHRRCLQEFFTLSESRAGRLQLVRRLKPVRSDWVRDELSAESKK
jgi:DNA-binding MarR family transcriptional regulator